MYYTTGESVVPILVLWVELDFAKSRARLMRHCLLRRRGVYWIVLLHKNTSISNFYHRLILVITDFRPGCRRGVI